MPQLKYILQWLFIGFVFFILAISCIRQDEFPSGKKIVCDAELLNKKGDRFIGVNDSTMTFDGGKLQTSLQAHSGRFSVLMVPKVSSYAFGYSVNNAGPDWYFVVSVWRKTKNGKGVLVASGKDSGKFYESTSDPVEMTSDGWEKLELEIYTPPWFNNNSVKFYVWNSGSDTVYFDDFVIERFAKKKYPSYNEKPLSIVLDTTDFLKLLEKRKTAFENSILQSGDNDWVKAIVFDGRKMMKAKMRLKGYWLDHLKGDKWSFRIKMKKDYAWRRLKTFSVQTPVARYFLKEWQAHKFYIDRDVLTTRYGFVPLILNNQKRGLYAWEEHFEKQLLEWRSRREGPILKFSEDAFWQVQKINYLSDHKKWIILPYYDATVIKPFKQSKTIKNPSLYNDFLNGQRLMMQYKKHLKPPASIFDLKKLATYFAMIDLTNVKHGMAWHNQRFYFNPILSKLEPIIFDCYTEHPHYSTGKNAIYAYTALNNSVEITPEQYLMYDLFTDSTFVSYYLQSLEEVSNEDYINKMNSQLKQSIIYYDSLIKMEFPYYEYDSNFISENAENIREQLPFIKQFVKEKLNDKDFSFNINRKVYNDTSVVGKTPEFFITAYLENVKNDSSFIRVYNYNPRKIIILGTGKKKKYVEFFYHPEPKMSPYYGDDPIYSEFVSDTNANYLFFMVDGRFETYSVEIIPWPYPEGNTPQQDLIESVDLTNEILIDKIVGKNIYIKTGKIQIEHPVVIPEGYRVNFLPGTKINFVNNAMFISYSPVFMKGEKENPIVINSSDFSANGFTILQASERSFLNNVIFENMNTLNYKGWTLTGSVTFYESDVTIRNTKFYRNQCEDALNTVRSDFDVDRAQFEYIYGDAFDSDFSTGKLSNSSFSNIGNDAIDFSGSHILIDHMEMTDVSDKGVSAGEESYLTVKNTNISRANIGLASKDLSVLEFDNGTLNDCNYGVVLLQKKPEYGPAKLIMNNTSINNPKTDMLIEAGSQVILDGDTIKGKKEKLAEIFYH